MFLDVWTELLLSCFVILVTFLLFLLLLLLPLSLSLSLSWGWGLVYRSGVGEGVRS